MDNIWKVGFLGLLAVAGIGLVMAGVTGPGAKAAATGELVGTVNGEQGTADCPGGCGNADGTCGSGCACGCQKTADSVPQTAGCSGGCGKSAGSCTGGCGCGS